MKGFFITTTTNETHKHHESFACIGHQVGCYIYNHARNPGASASGAQLDSEILAAAKAFAPDVIVYIGACGGNTPSPASFERLKNEVAPTVHFCSDAADDPWWPLLVEYDKARCFSLQVALDGTKNWPLADTQLTALTVVDHERFPFTPTPHAERPIIFGFAGNYGGNSKNRAIDPRRQMIDSMVPFGLQCRPRDAGSNTYPDYVDYLCRCRIVVNFPQTGTRRFLHVKGRVIEAALAGALLLEQLSSPTHDWFEPGVDYLEYRGVKDARKIVEHYAARPDESQEIAERLRKKVRDFHGPKDFWRRIFERIPALAHHAEAMRPEWERSTCYKTVVGVTA